MSKKLNIIEAMKMPIGTELEVILNGEEFGCVAKIIESNVQSKKQLVWDNRANSSIVVTDSISRAIFTPIQKPVSFMEVVKSNKNCKVEHELINNSTLDKYDMKMLRNEFNSLDWVLYFITNNQLDIQEIILNGEWYIEESEADSNDIR